MLSRVLSKFAIRVMRLLGCLPLAWLRALGWLLGGVLYGLVAPRRRVAQTNLRLCFPDWSEDQIRSVARSTFVHFAQAWLDRAWLWHGSPEVVLERLRLLGAVDELQGGQPVLVFLPHFVGLDAAGMALSQQVPRQFTSIYTNQSNKVIDAWILAGRQRFGNTQLFGRVDGVKSIVAALRAGDPLVLLPDMNFGPEESVFVPFYGVSAATVPSLSRFARMGRAKVVPVIARMTRHGYEIEIKPHWERFPSSDLMADTALMNQRLQSYIDTMPDQYFWVHKRFKDRPPGLPSVY